MWTLPKRTKSNCLKMCAKTKNTGWCVFQKKKKNPYDKNISNWKTTPDTFILHSTKNITSMTCKVGKGKWHPSDAVFHALTVNLLTCYPCFFLLLLAVDGGTGGKAKGRVNTNFLLECFPRQRSFCSLLVLKMMKTCTKDTRT